MNTVLFAVLCLGVLVTANVQADENVKRILDRGRDGDVNYYQVMCADNTMTSVTVTDQPPTICAQAINGQEICDGRWTLNQAASEACK